MNVNIGFEYTVEVVSPEGEVVSMERFCNRVPLAGLHYIIGSSLLGAAQTSTWYIAPYENDYTPLAGDVAATFPGAGIAGELTTYSETNRVAWVPGSASGGVIDNSASKAEFTFNADKTVRGLAMFSTATKGGTSGVLISAAKLPAAQILTSGSVLRVTADFTFTSS